MIYITGDTHGEYDTFLNRIYRHPVTKDDTVIVCGDFGFVWDAFPHRRALAKLAQEPFTIAFVDGNHENFDLLETYPVETWHGGLVHRIAGNILHLMRGQCFEIEGRQFFAMGGAFSHDKPMRTPSYDWWPQELPSAAEYETAAATLARCGHRVDHILTHTVPLSVLHALGATPDPHEAALHVFLERVYREVSFESWYAGHLHLDRRMGERVQVLFEEVVTL
ncbi:MAG: metallophosphoesterase [Oscillospiraceae bacterium]|nr:metallophosphoesterase [Oscillospiraceae bacterium]